jgi:hypothetical protein
MNKPVVLGFIRHLLTIAAGSLATRGVIDGAEVEIIVGSLIGLGGVIWSAFDKKGQ